MKKSKLEKLQFLEQGKSWIGHDAGTPNISDPTSEILAVKQAGLRFHLSKSLCSNCSTFGFWTAYTPFSFHWILPAVTS